MKSASYILHLTAALGAMSTLNAAITIDTVLVGDANNPADSLNSGSVPGIGSVSYDYHIGTYEVTNSQYTAFLNAVATTDTHGLYILSMDGITRSGSSGTFTYTATRPNAPVNYVSFWDAARFTNWLTSGDTETGVYNLIVDGITNNTITRDPTAWAAGGVAIASENEWYKAAFYQPVGTGGDTDSYWLYPTASNSITTVDANYGNSIGTLTDVGNYGSDASYYGTFDQGGNVWEWNDTIAITTNRGLRGGAIDRPASDLESSYRGLTNPTGETGLIGFRVSSLAPVPEPSTYALIFGALGLGAVLLKRRKR